MKVTVYLVSSIRLTDTRVCAMSGVYSMSWRVVSSECTALLSRRLGFGGVLDSGFSLCAVPTYYCRSEYFE